AFVVLDSPFQEIRALHFDDKGILYVAALPPPLLRPLSAATYSMPLSSKCSARISWNGESSTTNAFPSASMRSTLPGEPVPARRFPALSNASAVACVAFVL